MSNSHGISASRRSQAHQQHGYASNGVVHPLYHIWANVKQRCHNPTAGRYRDYGGRGIYLCSQWINSPEAFISWAFANGWIRGLQIDRIDNDGPYSPENCHFVTASENSRNRRNNLLLSAFGETKPVCAWVDDPRSVVDRSTIEYRIHAGWHPELAITKPSRRHKRMT